MIKTTTIAALALAFAAAAPAAGQTVNAAAPPQASASAPALALTLDEAVRRAVDHNPDLAVVRLGTEIQAAQVGESRTAYTPMFATQFGRSSNAAPPTSSLLGTSSIDTRDWFSSTGVRQRVPWGNGTWSVSWDASRTTSNSPLNSFDPILQSGIEIAFSQPLVRDRKMDVSRQQYLIAKRNEATSELQFRETVVGTVAAVKQAYWTLKALRANVTVQERSLQLAEQLAKENGIRVRLGQAPPIDLVQADAEVADRRENLIRARAAADDGEDRLRRLIMDPADPSFWQVRLDAADEPSGRTPLPNVEAIVAKAMNDRSDVARAQNAVDIAATNAEFFANQLLPDVRLETSYRGSGLGGSQLLRTGAFPGIVTGTVTSGFGGVLGQVFGPDYPAWSLGVTVSYPIGRSFEQAKHVEAEVERRQAAARVASVQLDVAASLRQAARQVSSAAEREDAARAAATLADQRLDAEQRRYGVGLSTSFLVTQAQRDLLQAQVNLLQATLDYQSSVVSFEALQLAPAVSSGDAVSVSGSAVQPVPIATPRGIFRPGAGGVQP
jgi:outer membrane protein